MLSGAIWFVSSFLIIFWICQALELEGRTWLVMGTWLVSGATVLWPGSDGLIARFLLGLRQPTMVERQRLTPSWLSVSRRAGVDADRYTLWIKDTESSTGSAAGGHTVAVTGWAMYTLPPSHLEAVLAHDLATHLRGRTWLSRLVLWYSIPTRIVALAVRMLLKLSRTLPAVGCTIVGFLLIAYLGIILVALVFYDSLAVPLLYLTPLLAPLIFVGLSRWNERMADRASADLGYGRRLLEVFYGWQAQHQDASRRMGTAQPDWLAGQPSVAERIRALEAYLQAR
ncbi:MAG TPA: M48 family metalloprotease [Kribbella sp.]|nr:M48 family metalloprotease [Kribbella sp.]